MPASRVLAPCRSGGRPGVSTPGRRPRPPGPAGQCGLCTGKGSCRPTCWVSRGRDGVTRVVPALSAEAGVLGFPWGLPRTFLGPSTAPQEGVGKQADR